MKFLILLGIVLTLCIGGFIGQTKTIAEINELMKPLTWEELKETKAACDEDAASKGLAPCKAWGVFYSKPVPAITIETPQTTNPSSSSEGTKL